MVLIVYAFATVVASFFMKKIEKVIKTLFTKDNYVIDRTERQITLVPLLIPSILIKFFLVFF